MSITGDTDSAPLRVGYPVADTVGGLTAALAISAALNGRARTGGTFIDVSMLEAMLATMGWVVSNWLIAGVEPAPMGNENVTASPSATFRTAEGLLNISANKQEQWEVLCAHLGLPDLPARPEYRTRDDRIANRLALKAELEAVLRARPAGVWADRLNDIGVPSGAVLSVPEILDHPQVAGRDFLATFADAAGVGRDVRIARTGVKLDGEAPSVSDPPPLLGQHNGEIYSGLGLSAAEIERLEEAGVI
jgi:crotonobetainyl-CoA:carnitine CoA-transferase CaiB-like acyl-CoA transferase